MRSINSPETGFVRPFSTALIRGGIGLFVGGLVLFFMFRTIDMREVWALLRTAHWEFIGLGLASVGVNFFSKVFRWQVLMGERRDKTSFVSLVAAVLLGQLLNFLVPGRVGDFARALMVGGDTGRAFTFGTVALEKWIETLAFVLLILSFLFFVPLPRWLEVPPWSLLVIFGVGLVVLVGTIFYAENVSATIVRLGRHIPVALSQRVIPPVQAGLDSVRVLGRKKNVLGVVILTGLVWGTALFNNYAGMRALGIILPFSVAVVLLFGLQIGIVVAASPAGLGIFEAICVYTLVFFGVEQTLALGFGILLHALILVPQILGGLWALVWWGFRFSPASP